MPKSRGVTRWVLDFRTLNSVLAFKDPHSEEECSTSPVTRTSNENPITPSWNEEFPPPPTSGPGHGQPWSAGSWGWCRIDTRGPRPRRALSLRTALPIIRTRVESHTPFGNPPQSPVFLTSSTKNINRSNRNRKWAYQNNIETNMQT